MVTVVTVAAVNVVVCVLEAVATVGRVVVEVTSTSEVTVVIDGDNVRVTVEVIVCLN